MSDEGLVALERAARSGKGLEDALERLPKKSSERSAWLTAALVAAAGSGADDAPDRVAMLIDRGADPNAPHQGRPPLHEAATRGDLPTIERLLERGADLDAADIIENTPLMCAANGGQEAAVRFFIERGASLSHATTIGETALTTAIDHCSYGEERSDACIELLLDAGAPVSAARKDSPRSPLRSAVEHGVLALAKRLVEAGADPRQSSMDDGLVHLAAQKGHLAFVEWLDELGVPLDDGYRSPIEVAAKRGRTAVVRYLMERGQTVDPLALLHGAAREGEVEGIAFALELGADPNGVYGHGDTRALILAAGSGRVEAVDALLAAGADPNGQNARGESAMTVARDDAVRDRLRAAGALEERMELIDAAERGDLSEVRTLLESGARPDVAVEDYGARRGLTPLMAAAAEGHTATVAALLDAGAAPDRVDEDQWSAAMHAADGGHLDVVRALIDGGADLRLKDRQGFGAHALAADAGHDEVREALEAVNAHRDLREELHEVMRNDDADALAELIELGLDPAAGPEHLLARAAYDGRSAIVRHLFEREPELGVDSVRQYGKTPLMCAAMKGELELFEALLDRGADLSLTDDEGWTPFVIACGNHADGIVKWLLERELVDDAQLSAGLRACLDHPSPEVLVELLNRGPILDSGDRRQVMAAQMIVDEGEDVPIRFDDAEQALRSAVLDGHAALAAFLLAEGVEPKPAHPADPPLVTEVRDPAVLKALAATGAALDGSLARMCGRLHGPEDDESIPADLLELLLERCDVNETDGYGLTPLMGAARAGHPLVARLIEAGATVNAVEDGRTAIAEAARAGHMETVHQLVGAGADLGAIDADGRTLPMLMADGGDLEGARALVEAGAPVAGLTLAAARARDAEAVREALALERAADAFDPARTDRDGWTLGAHVAAMADEALLAEVLEAGVGTGDLVLGAAVSFEPSMIAHVAELGAPMDATDELGRTALHVAAAEAAVDCASALLDRGADPNVADIDGFTPLMEAVDADAEEVARLLVERGADRRAKDRDGRTAHDRLRSWSPESLGKVVRP